MSTITYLLTSLFIIFVILTFCFLIRSFTKRTIKSKGKTKFKGAFKFLKIFEFNFEAEYEDNKK